MVTRTFCDTCGAEIRDILDGKGDNVMNHTRVIHNGSGMTITKLHLCDTHLKGFDETIKDFKEKSYR